MGSTGCPEMSARNFRSTLCNISEEWKSQMTIWQSRKWFGSTWSSSERSCWAQCSSVLHMWI